MLRQFTVLLLCCLLYSSVQAQSNVPYETFVQAGDNQELIDAINAANNGTGARRIVIVPGSNDELEYVFTMPIAGTSDALPMITSRIEFIVRGANDQRVTFRRDTNAPQFRLLTVGQRGSLLMRIMNVEDFSINGNGGAVLVQGNGLFSANRVGFNRNFASGNGGAVASTDNGRIYVSRLDLMNNRANVVGGVFSVEGDSTASIGTSVFRDNTAGVFGCAVNLNSQGTFFQQTLGLFGNTFQAGCDNVLIENPRGIIDVRGNTLFGLGEGIDSADTVRLFSSIFDLGPPGRRSMQKATCNDFGNGAFQSDGFNIETGDECFLDHPTDQSNTDPMLTVTGADATPSLLAGSPAIDAGASEITNAVQEKNGLPCPYVDARGLGRPQDANLDGVYECDIGSYEVQGGPDIGAAQSAAYFDTSRNGEGVFVEMLGNGLAFVAEFTYRADGSGPAWFVGIGDVVGNSIVVPNLLQPVGGVFGAAYDPDLVDRQFIGAMSLVFSNCASGTGAPGRQLYQSETGAEFGDLLVDAFRLSTVVDCQGNSTPQAGRSGSFFDPARDGEGIFVQWLTNGQVIVIWYTFDPQGNQFWTISGDVTIDGNTVTANMLYPAASTRFGAQFNADDINLQPFGTVTLQYMPGCNTMTFSYNSTVAGFGAGSYNYSRLTSLTGTTCDL